MKTHFTSKEMLVPEDYPASNRRYLCAMTSSPIVERLTMNKTPVEACDGRTHTVPRRADAASNLVLSIGTIRDQASVWTDSKTCGNKAVTTCESNLQPL